MSNKMTDKPHRTEGDKFPGCSNIQNSALLLKKYDESNFQPLLETREVRTKLENNHMVVVSGNDNDLYLHTSKYALKKGRMAQATVSLDPAANTGMQSKLYFTFDSEKAMFPIMVESITDYENDDAVDVVTITDQSISKEWKLHYIHFMVKDPIVVKQPDTEDSPLHRFEGTAEDNVDVLCTFKSILKILEMEYNHSTGGDPIDVVSETEGLHGDDQENEKENRRKDWTKCAQEKDVNAAYKLLNEDILPIQEDLQLAFDNFIDDSEGKELLKSICQKIENHLMERNESIENVKGCIKHGDPGRKVIFVIQTTSEEENIDCQYTYHVIEQHIEQANEEMEIEKLTGYQCKERFYDANECLRIKSPSLMESHSNLTGTSLSTIKMRKCQDPEQTLCIVFYVEAKGYVPVGEDPFPSHLEYENDTVFKTDVRECQCAIATAGPSDKHEDLKTGCRIESSKVPDGGTLGGFIDHPDHGLCAITCSHVLLTVEQFDKFYNRRMSVKSLPKIQCFQPMQPDICGEVCDVRLFKGNENNGGMDIAFVKIEESRKPKTPSFPDIFADAEEMIGKRPPFIDDLLSQTLRYDPRSVIQNSKQMKDYSQVVKYGFKSKLTSGIVHCFGSSRKFQIDGHFFTEGRNAKTMKRKSRYVLTDQIQIRDDYGQFSDSGDSGAMVFVTNENKELMALGILTGRVDQMKTTFVTPIWNVLKEIKMPVPYNLAEPRSARMVIEELKRRALLISKNCEDLTRVLGVLDR